MKPSAPYPTQNSKAYCTLIDIKIWGFIANAQTPSLNPHAEVYSGTNAINTVLSFIGSEKLQVSSPEPLFAVCMLALKILSEYTGLHWDFQRVN